jgi:hypothetical protein
MSRIGKDTREALFKDRSALGERVHLNGIPFTEIGEFEPKGRMFGNNFDQVAAMPYSTMEKYSRRRRTRRVPRRGELPSTRPPYPRSRTRSRSSRSSRFCA